MSTQTLWHRRVAKQAVRSASRQDEMRTGLISLRVPRITPLVLDNPAPAYSEPFRMDIRSPTSPPPDFDTLEPGPRHHDYTPYIPSGLELEPLGEPVQDLFDFSSNAGDTPNSYQEGYYLILDFLDLGRNLRNLSPALGNVLGDALGDAHPTSIVELPPSHSCNFAYYGLLPPCLDPGPTAPLSHPIPYPLCNSVDCWAVEHVGVPAHHQGPYQDPSIPKALHDTLNSFLEAHGLNNLFQNGSVPPPEVWNAVHRVIDGTAEEVSGPFQSVALLRP